MHRTQATLLGSLVITLLGIGCASGPRPIAWDRLPFPKDSDWPGPKGAPATIGQGELVLQAQDVRTQRSYSAPLTLECDAHPDNTNAPNTWLQVKFVPVGEPADAEPKQMTVVVMGNRNAPPSGDQDVVFITRRAGASSKEIWGEQAFAIKTGEPYRLRCEVLPDRIRITINDQTFDAAGATVDYKEFYIQLDGWQPPNRWHVRNLLIH
jgi:hypothetical protein